MLETFFALEVATLIREPERYADRLAWPEGAEPGHKAWKANHYPLIYSVYAGGDDLFLLGPWNVILEFALDLAPLYRAYTQHPGFTLSGGFATMRPHLPIPQLSQLVKSLEEDAKVANKADEARRGHLALFGQAVPWDSLLEVRRWAEGLQRDLEGRRVSKAQVYRWLRLHREYTRSLTAKEADVGRAMRYKPLLAYALRPKGQQDQDLYERYGDLLNHAHPAWVHLPVWVQWGLYAQREDLHDRVL
jgi:CRISPR-associated protein Csm1